MQIQTKYFGEIEINQEEVIHFPQGIPGFINEKEFILQNFEESGLFQVLQSTKGMDPAFLVINPFLFVKDFEINLDDASIEQLNIVRKEDVEVLSIVTVKEPLSNSTANLQAPLIINRTNYTAKQFITNSSVYKTQEQIFKQTSRVKGE
ncbi:flagellar assembly protein FliW [Gracilibacillus sp. D59]|uniref:flagellar assembly protein FliW n=1 Tax=Gracilibacillus sp. D59 TaxID=3457434 RepID=UPI003FCC7EB3